MASEIMQRRVSSHISVESGGADVSKSNGARGGTVRRVRKRRKKSAFRAHFGKERQEMVMLLFFGVVISCLAIIVVFRIIMGSTKMPVAVEKPKKKNEKKSLWQTLFGGVEQIPGSMAMIGDKTAAYFNLRDEYSELLPNDPSRSLNAVQNLRKQSYQLKPMNASTGKATYDVYNCPKEPPIGYPYAWNIMELLDNWPPDDTTPRKQIYQGICVFDYNKDFDKAMYYRTMEKPFVVRNDPEVAKTAERWNAPGYMDRLMGNVRHRTEVSQNNHFMYWMPPKKGNKKILKRPGVYKPKNWTAPTEMTRMPYQAWLSHANVTDEFLGPERPHWYYRLIGCGQQGSCDRDSSEYLFDELTFFQPKQGLYLTEPAQQKGIHCRFGMKGVIAENHFDASRNSIVVLGGSRRYILSHPNQCERLALLPQGHPSGRHSAVDWSSPDLDKYPQFKTAESNEVILQPGEVLYLPTHWFHYIISLELNFQCNTRSGVNKDYKAYIKSCGF